MRSAPQELIARKRDGGELTEAELREFITAYLAGGVDDAQVAALLMAGVIRGFTTTEAIALTDVLVASGEVIDLSDLRGPTVDKHSTGGVGDVTTLIVAPLLAAAGCQVAKLSGRGLGHTGGTLDKLEAIPGMRVDLSSAALRHQVEDIGLAVAAATQDLVPADKRLYALRDVTATVGNDALIASSVMSKKIAGGAQHVLLDVKTGDGAFMPDIASAQRLAALCVDIGRARQRHTGALVTDMSQPLGDGIGNALEVRAAIDVLRGEQTGRLAELSCELAAAALTLTGTTIADARSTVSRLLSSGAALERFCAFVTAQGGDPAVVDNPAGVLPAAPVVRHWTGKPGVIQSMACRQLGALAGTLGAGRQRQGDTIDPAVGLVVGPRIGDTVDGDRPVVTVHARNDDDATRVLHVLEDLIRIDDAPCRGPDLISARIGLPTEHV